MLGWVLGRVGDAGHTGGRRGDSLAKNARVILQGNKVRALDDRRLNRPRATVPADAKLVLELVPGPELSRIEVEFSDVNEDEKSAACRVDESKTAIGRPLF